MLLGWLNPGTGVLNMLNAMMWELLVPITLLSYFLIHLKHPFFKSRPYNLLYLPFIITLVIDVLLELDYSMNLYELPFTEDAFYIYLYYEIENWSALSFNAASMLWSLALVMKSSLDKRIKKWLIRLDLMFLIIISIWLIRDLGVIFLSRTFSSHLILASISIIIWTVLYLGVFKLQIIIEGKEIHKLVERSFKGISHQVSIKNNKETNITEQKSKYTIQLIQLLEKDKLYKNPALSRSDIAAELNISEGYLSQTINQDLGKSIIQLIHEYRIMESKELLQNQSFRKYSLEAIGLESGFKSKSVFYDVFKTSTGMSPGEFRKMS
jgi:AraC-like DNA-binding protein